MKKKEQIPFYIVTFVVLFLSLLILYGGRTVIKLLLIAVAYFVVQETFQKRKKRKLIKKVEEERIRLNRLKLLEEEQLLVKQEKCAKVVERKYIEIKDDEKIENLTKNFFREIPEAIFLSEEYFTLFEVILMMSNENILDGEKVLWSIPDKYLKIKKMVLDEKIPIQELELTVNFIEGDFSRFTNLLAKKVDFENDSICVLTGLKLLHIESSSFYSNYFLKKCGSVLGDIKKQSLLNSLYLYYRYCDDVFNDPHLVLLVYYLIENRKFGDVENLEYFNFIKRRHELLKILEEKREDFEFLLFQERMERKIEKDKSKYLIQNVDLMTGEEFEHFVAEIFRKMGYMSKVTQLSGDYGIDVIAEREGVRIGIQAKRYSGSVSNSAIQEVVAGMKYHECEKGVVVTNSTFTKAAKKLAEANSIRLWDRSALEEKIIEVFSEEAEK